jgi:hypothetical protein
MSNLITREATINDVYKIKQLYLDITTKYPDNLSLFTNEVTDEFIYENLQAALERGNAQVMEDYNGDIVAYFKGYTTKNIRKAHILDNATMIVRADYMNSVVAYRFFSGLFKAWSGKMKHIKHVRTVPHFNNNRVLRISEAVGMKKISTHESAIICKDGSFTDEVTLIWENPNFSQESLLEYHQYLMAKYSPQCSYQIAKDSRSKIAILNDKINAFAISV